MVERIDFLMFLIDTDRRPLVAIRFGLHFYCFNIKTLLITLFFDAIQNFVCGDAWVVLMLYWVISFIIDGTLWLTALHIVCIYWEQWRIHIIHFMLKQLFLIYNFWNTV